MIYFNDHSNQLCADPGGVTPSKMRRFEKRLRQPNVDQNKPVTQFHSNGDITNYSSLLEAVNILSTSPECKSTRRTVKNGITRAIRGERDQYHKCTWKFSTSIQS